MAALGVGDRQEGKPVLVLGDRTVNYVQELPYCILQYSIMVFPLVPEGRCAILVRWNCR
jgi:hypothetical protein